MHNYFSGCGVFSNRESISSNVPNWLNERIVCTPAMTPPLIVNVFIKTCVQEMRFS